MSGYYLMYLRKSRADAEKERYGKYETLAVHEGELTELARRQRLPVAQVYRELVSGETIEARAEFRRVMDRIADPDCEGVIVHAIDRLGRGDPMEYGWILSSFRYTGTLIVTPGRTYDPSDADDLQQLKLQMFVSNIEFEHIRQRLQRGSEASARRGNYIGSKPPYGYDKVAGRSAIVPNEAEAPVVRTIYRMASEGRNKGAIARSLNESGIPTRHGGTWTPARIGTVLSNPVYKGMVRYGYRRQRVVSRDGMRFVRRTSVSGPGDYILAKGAHEPLVPTAVWDAAQRAFEASPVPRDRTMKNPLSGLIVCAGCGRALVRQVVTNRQGRKYPRLHHCYNTPCHCRSAALADVMAALADALSRAADDLEMGVLRAGSDPGEVEAIERALAEEDRRLDKLMELFYADAIDVAEFKERRAASDELTRRMRRRHDELVANGRDAVEITAKAREAIALIGGGEASAEQVNDCLRSIIERIDYRREDRYGGEITLDVHLKGGVVRPSMASSRSASTAPSA